MKTDNEIKLEITLQDLQEQNKWIELQLHPEPSSSIIDGNNNKCLINEGRLGKFDGISERFYDKMVILYDSREQRNR